jgi:thioredoxin 2
MSAHLQLDERGVVMPCPSCGKSNRLAYERLGNAAKCGQCGTALPAPGAPVEVATTAQFDLLTGRSRLPVLVDFWAPWCGPCRMVAPEVAKVAERERGRLVVAKVNTDELSEVAARLRIMSIPTLAVYVGGREAARTAGALPAERIAQFVTSAIQSESAGRAT